MKKLLFLLLCTVSLYGQTLQNPTFGTVTSKTNVEDNSAEKVLVQNSLGKLNWIYKNSLIPDNFTKVVYVDNNNPNSATIFDLNNPPTVNDNLLKSDVNNLYIGLDASTWVYSSGSSLYVTKTIPAAPAIFNYAGTSVPAGNTTSPIVRNGSIQAPSFIRTGTTPTNALLAGGGSLANPVSGTGATGQISFWNGSATQTGDNALFWDNTNKRLGIGTTAPVGKLDIFTGLSGVTASVNDLPNGTFSFINGATGNASPAMISRTNDASGLLLIAGTNNSNLNSDMSFNVRENDNTDFLTLTNVAFRFSRFATPLFDILRNGNATLLGTLTANGALLSGETASTIASFDSSKNVKSLPLATYPSLAELAFVKGLTSAVQTQLNAKAPLASPALTGTPTAPTAPAGTNTTQVATTAFVLANARPYKVYTALISQSGTSAPVATVLENTLGGTVVWTRVAPGVYEGTLSGAFTLGRTVGFSNIYGFGAGCAISPKNINSVNLSTFATSTGALGDAIINPGNIEIRVYP